MSSDDGDDDDDDDDDDNVYDDKYDGSGKYGCSDYDIRYSWPRIVVATL